MALRGADMGICLHRPLCPNECPCDYLVTEPENEGMKLILAGSAITYAECPNCGQTVQYPTDRPYNNCPYCGRRVK